MGELHQDILEAVQNINIELLIFIGRKKIYQQWLKELNTILIEQLILLYNL